MFVETESNGATFTIGDGTQHTVWLHKALVIIDTLGES